MNNVDCTNCHDACACREKKHANEIKHLKDRIWAAEHIIGGVMDNVSEGGHSLAYISDDINRRFEEYGEKWKWDGYTIRGLPDSSADSPELPEQDFNPEDAPTYTSPDSEPLEVKQGHRQVSEKQRKASAKTWGSFPPRTQQANGLCKNPKFREYVIYLNPFCQNVLPPVNSQAGIDLAKLYIYDRCGIDSRKELTEDRPDALYAFKKLLSEFKQWEEG